MTRPTYLLMDANVLIDFLEVADEVYWLLAEHIGPLRVAADVLREVDQLTAQRCTERRIEIVEANLEQVIFASQPSGALSSQDKLCLKLCIDHEWTCVTNDKALRRACEEHDVPVH